MTGKKKSNTVSWASGSKLCQEQVKHFRKSDPPFKVSQKVRNIPHRKKPSHFPTTCPSAYVPLKNEANMNQTNEKLHKIPHIKWEIPPMFVLDSDWLVASGEESEETKVQKPEAMYYTPSPYKHSDIDDRCFDDSQTPIIPIIPSEEADSSAKTLNNMLMIPPKSVLEPDRSKNSITDPMEGDALLAAVAAVTAITRSMDPGSLIDTDLLIKFLKDPDLTLQLINSSRFVANNTEPGRKAIEEVVSVPTPSVLLTKCLGQPKDRMGMSSLERLTTKTGTGGGSILDLPNKKFIGGQSQVRSEMFNIPTTPIISPPPIVTGSVFGATDPTSGNTAQPDLTVIKRMIRDYGLSDNSHLAIPGGPDRLATGNDNPGRPISHSEPFGESGALSPMKQHLSYYQYPMKQHGEPHTSIESNTQSYLHMHKPKTQETCFYFNTAKGCRNGSR